jgi:hypothetical protein
MRAPALNATMIGCSAPAARVMVRREKNSRHLPLSDWRLRFL